MQHPFSPSEPEKRKQKHFRHNKAAFGLPVPWKLLILRRFSRKEWPKRGSTNTRAYCVCYKFLAAIASRRFMQFIPLIIKIKRIVHCCVVSLVWEREGGGRREKTLNVLASEINCRVRRGDTDLTHCSVLEILTGFPALICVPSSLEEFVFTVFAEKGLH